MPAILRRLLQKSAPSQPMCQHKAAIPGGEVEERNEREREREGAIISSCCRAEEVLKFLCLRAAVGSLCTTPGGDQHDPSLIRSSFFSFLTPSQQHRHFLLFAHHFVPHSVLSFGFDIARSSVCASATALCSASTRVCAATRLACS